MEVSWGPVLVTARFFNHGGPSLAPQARSETLRTPQNAPAWLYPSPSIMLRLAVINTGPQLTSMIKKTWCHQHGPQPTSMIKKRDVTNTGPQLTTMIKKRNVTNTGPNWPLWLKSVTSPTRGPNWPFRCLDERQIYFENNIGSHIIRLE